MDLAARSVPCKVARTAGVQSVNISFARVALPKSSLRGGGYPYGARTRFAATEFKFSRQKKSNFRSRSRLPIPRVRIVNSTLRVPPVLGGFEHARLRGFAQRLMMDTTVRVLRGIMRVGDAVWGACLSSRRNIRNPLVSDD